MIRRWCIYLGALTTGIGLYVASSGWLTWVALLTVAGLPLFSVLLRKPKAEYDSLGLFRFPTKKAAEYEQRLRPYRPGDNLSRVHWKLAAKTGALTAQEERIVLPEAAFSPGIFAPVLLCLGVVFCLFPPGKYDRQMEFLQKMLLRPVGQMAYLDLKAVGPLEENKQAMLDVVATESQVLYLRGQAFDIYDGTSWSASAWEDNYWPKCDPEGAATVTIATRSPEGYRYFPYYIAGEECVLTRGALENKGNLQEYTYRQQRAIGAEGGASPKQCLQLPEETKIWAEGVLEALFGTEALRDTEKIEKIQNFVKNCAKYDKNTPQISGDGDFARRFVENGQGYCVHFATAATVLLRCAGIPARLATGYCVTVQGGVRKTVAGSDAHAWVEYLCGGIWQVLEATPGWEEAPLPVVLEEREENYGGFWVLGMVMVVWQLWVWLRSRKRLARFLGEDGAVLEKLAQKAAYSRNGLTPEEENLYRACLRKLPRHKRAVYRIFGR